MYIMQQPAGPLAQRQHGLWHPRAGRGGAVSVGSPWRHTLVALPAFPRPQLGPPFPAAQQRQPHLPAHVDARRASLSAPASGSESESGLPPPSLLAPSLRRQRCRKVLPELHRHRPAAALEHAQAVVRVGQSHQRLTPAPRAGRAGGSGDRWVRSSLGKSQRRGAGDGG